MREYIKKIQAKDEDKRKQILLWLMIGSMSVVSVVWAYSLGMRFGGPKIKEQTKEDLKPFKLFSNSISDAMKNVGASVGNAPSVNKIKEQQEVSTPVEEGKQIDLIPVEYTNQ